MDRGLFGLTFEEAREVVLKRRLDESVTYPIMTKQAIAIGTKIAEVDALLTERPKRRDGWWRFILSCLSCGSRRPLDPRSLTDSRRKKRTTGYAARLGLVAEVTPDSDAQLAAITWPRADVARDDPLDAYAALWSAHRHRHGVSETLGGHEHDERGLLQRMVI
jgi:predicted RNase H-like nuclease